MKLITTTAELESFIDHCSGFDYVTIDTEFLREKTYWPQLCLIQIASPEEGAIIDPLVEELDLGAFFTLLQAPGVVKVFHSGRQDVEIFWYLKGIIPKPLFDTQIAGMVCGHGNSASYDALVRKIVGIGIDKSMQFSDWAKRPLNDEQLSYALNDVLYLRDVYEALRAELSKNGRRGWLDEEMALLTSSKTYQQNPKESWKRLKARVHRRYDLALLQALSAWREETAQRLNIPRGWVIKDDIVHQIALQKPQNKSTLFAIRGLRNNQLSSSQTKELIETISAILALPEDELPQLPERTHALEKQPALYDLLSVLLKSVSEREGVASKLIATASDIHALARSDSPENPVLQGWRYQIFGRHALSLKKGDIALGTDGKLITIIPLQQNTTK